MSKTKTNTVTIACDAGQIQTIVGVANSFVADPPPKTQPSISISPNKSNTLWTISVDYDRDTQVRWLRLM